MTTPNPILREFRTYVSDPVSAYETHEWLYQLARHWAEWQDYDTGTFPLDYRDPYGPASRAESEATGEDWTYWVVADVIALLPPGEAQPAIAHATRVLSRLDDWLEANGRGI